MSSIAIETATETIHPRYIGTRFEHSRHINIQSSGDEADVCELL
jgi:hypothetical protein